MKKILILILSFSSVYSFAQKIAKPDAFAKTITPEELKRQLYIIASPEMEGRETASEGQRKAAAYIENQFKEFGLQPGNNGSYQLYYNVYQDSLTDAALEVNGQAFQMDKDFNASAADITATMRFSEVVFVGANATDSLKNANLAGRVVLLTGVVQQGRRPGGIFGTLLSKGVAAILIVDNNYPRANAANRKGNMSVSLYRRNISPQTFTVSENVARAILGNDYETAKSNTSHIKSYAADVLLEVKKTTIALQSSDVVGVLPGTDLKDQYLVISAHYDHLGKRNGAIYYGADDDGSGTVSIIEMAKAFAKAKAAGKGPRRTIVFLANSGEEEGLWGSDYFTSHPTIPLEKTTADLNIDMIGRIDADRKQGDSTNYVYVVGDDKLSTDLRTISEDMNKKYMKMELDYKFNDPNDPNNIYFRSDHYNFAKHGVPIIFYYDGMLHADYHRPTDTPDKINYDLLAKRARLVFYTAWEMANRNDQLKRDIALPVPTRRSF